MREDHLETEIVVGGPLSDRKGVNVPDVALPIPALTAKDREDLAFVLEHGIESALEQWVMFGRVWPDRRPEPVKIFPTGSPIESELLEKVVSHLPEIKVGEDGD